MKEEVNKYELFELFLKGEINSRELTDFKSRLDSDPDFAAEFQKYQELHNLIIDKGLIDIKENINKIHNNKIRTRKIIRNFTAGFGIVIITTLLFLNNKNEINKAENKNIGKHDTTIVHDSVKVPTDFEKKEQITKTETINKHNQKINTTEKKDTSLHTMLPDTTNKTIDTIAPEIETEAQNITEITDSLQDIKPIQIQIDTSDKIDCSKTEIYAKIETKESCDDKASGEILFISSMISGGEPPYKFSIDNGINFYNQIAFKNLKGGLYHLSIKDKYNCIQKLGAYRIEIQKCSYEYAFAPDKGETWQVPNKNKDCILFIFSKEGRIVLKKQISAFECFIWDGKSENGTDLQMGIYRFILKYTEMNEELNGYVTIIK